ncbi:hypothetical protein ACHAXH_003606 [Discostella pseudostelligera]
MVHVRSDNGELSNEPEYPIEGSKLHPSFRPHPIRNFCHYQSPQNQSDFHQSVFLDGSADISMRDITVILNEINNTDEVRDASEDGSTSRRTQTVVWDDACLQRNRKGGSSTGDCDRSGGEHGADAAGKITDHHRRGHDNTSVSAAVMGRSSFGGGGSPLEF